MKLTRIPLCIVIAVAGLLCIISPQKGYAQKNAGETVLLWPEVQGELEHAQGETGPDTPTLTAFLPEKPAASKTAVIVFPGGGYAHLAMDKEGYQVAEWLNSLGIAAFVVKYRLGHRYNHPNQLKDAQKAIRMVRANAERWDVNGEHVGILGFSAGGHLASTAGTHFDGGDAGSPPERISSRPDFMVLIYPVITMESDYMHEGSRDHLLGENPGEELISYLSNEKQVTRKTPPTFLVHGSNDAGVPVQNSLQFYKALLEHNVPAEMHLFEDGPHGFGMAADDEQLSQWPVLCERWMKSIGLLSP